MPSRPPALPPVPPPPPATSLAPRWAGLELAAILASFLVVVGSAAALPVRDVPLGIDWQRYLGNALAIARNDWPSYQTWRSPLHAFACLLLTPVAGHLLEASQLVSMLSVGAIVLATAAVGRRMLGPGGGAIPALVLAGWPDLALQARMSTPYPLLAGLVASASYALDRGFFTDTTGEGSRSPPRLHWLAVAVTGVLFGLAAATDARGLVYAGAAVLGTACAAAPGWRQAGRIAPHWVAFMVVLALCGGVREVVVGRLPVQLLPLGEQIALQRDLHAREAGIPACSDKHAATVLISDLWGACGRETAARNLGRLSPMSPWPVFAVGLLGALGIRRRTLPLVAICGTMVPALFIVGLEHRYLLPMAGPVAILLSSGAMRLGSPRITRRAGAPAAAGLLLAAGLAIGWRTRAETLLERASGQESPPRPGRPPGGAGPAEGEGPRPPAHTQSIQVDALPPIAVARRMLREKAVPSAAGGPRVVDCAGLSLDERLYPTDVEEFAFNGHSSAKCKRLLASPSSPGVWVLTREEAGASWVVEGTAGADLKVLRGR